MYYYYCVSAVSSLPLFVVHVITVESLTVDTPEQQVLCQVCV